MLITNNYVIHVKALKNFRHTSFSPVQKSVRKMAISSSFEGFGTPEIKIVIPPSIDYGRVLNPLRFFFNLVPGHNYGVFR